MKTYLSSIYKNLWVIGYSTGLDGHDELELIGNKFFTSKEAVLEELDKYNLKDYIGLRPVELVLGKDPFKEWIDEQF